MLNDRIISCSNPIFPYSRTHTKPKSRGTDGMTSHQWNTQKYTFLITRLYFSATNRNQMTFPESTPMKTSKFTFSRELEHFIDSKAASLLGLSIRISQISKSLFVFQKSEPMRKPIFLGMKFYVKRYF